jgi:alcohol dehydrogenase
LGAVHALAYPIASDYKLTHGRSTAVILPHVMSFNLPANLEKYARIGEAMGAAAEGLNLRERAEKAVGMVRNLLAQVGVSIRLRDYGALKNDTRRLACEAMKFSRLFKPNPRDLTEDDAFGIYEEAW